MQRALLDMPRVGLGLGLDMPWGARAGFVHTPDGDAVAEPTRRFLERHGHRFGSLFLSLQPRDRCWPQRAAYQDAWDDVMSLAPPVRALHHTALNLAAIERTDRARLLTFTNEMIRRYDLQWVNEDLGFWSVRGRTLPYPLPPLLTDAGVAACVRNAVHVDERLAAPLVLEFPGFAAGSSVVVGDLHAYDHFRRVVQGAQVACTLDVGHLLSYQWLRGLRGEDLVLELERLPLAHCFELHLSGCAISGERFLDLHHGVLLDEQLELTWRLLERCPNLRVVTYEDARFDDQGRLPARAVPAFEALERGVAAWMEQPRETVLIPTIQSEAVDVPPDADAALVEQLHRPGADPTLSPDVLVQLQQVSRRLAGEVLQHRQRGTGRVIDAYPGAVAAWRAAHPDDGELRALGARFVASAAYGRHRALPWTGLGDCVEHAFAAFFATLGLLDPDALEAERLRAVVLALLVNPDPAFCVPPGVRRQGRGWVAVHRPAQGAPRLVAAVSGRLVSGEITPLLADLVEGRAPEPVVAASGAAVGRLREMGVL
jgi:uncharacterized protein (UPF0276 family)